MAPVREPQENKGPHLWPGSQPNLQDEYAFISQKFLVECAKAFFPLQSRQTRQVYFGQPSHHHPGPACQMQTASLAPSSRLEGQSLENQCPGPPKEAGPSPHLSLLSTVPGLLRTHLESAWRRQDPRHHEYLSHLTDGKTETQRLSDSLSVSKCCSPQPGPLPRHTHAYTHTHTHAHTPFLLTAQPGRYLSLHLTSSVWDRQEAYL